MVRCSPIRATDTQTEMIYRKEIDGLRAVAVVPVILFHAGFSLFSGGYVGVDVFFVISGYLITTIIISELEQGKFSIAGFYERRARRILPALFFVIACCIPFALLWMVPAQLTDFSSSVIAVIFFASNILFWKQEGYFAPAAETKPLLHTWSLAVEEQYYLLFPLFLMLAWRYGRNRVFWAVCAMALISLIASEWAWRAKPSANFYLAPTRAWELLAGSMCAFWLTQNSQRPSNWLSLAGLALITFAVFVYDEKTPFPSIYAFAPVAGTALIILFAGTGTWTARLLSTRGFVMIGLISYSAYLWHQPLLAFARIRSHLDPPLFQMGALAALSLVLAYFSWRFIEQPFRKGPASLLPTRGAVFAASGTGAAVLLSLSAAGLLSDGNPINRYDMRTMALLEKFDYREVTWDNKMRLRRAAFPDNGKRNILVIGDSNSADLLNALIFAFGDEYNFSSSTIFAGCGNLYLPRESFADAPDVEPPTLCTRSDTYEQIAGLIKDADYVFLATSWRGFEVAKFPASWARLNSEFGEKFFVFGAKNIEMSSTQIFRTDFDKLADLTFPPNRTRVRINRSLADITRDRFINPYDWLCPDQTCRFMSAGAPVYYDQSHLTEHGTRLLAASLKKWSATRLCSQNCDTQPQGGQSASPQPVTP